MRSLTYFFIVYAILGFSLSFCLATVQPRDIAISPDHFVFKQSELAEASLNKTSLDVDFPASPNRRIPKTVAKRFEGCWGYSRSELATIGGVEKIFKAKPRLGSGCSLLAQDEGRFANIYGEPLTELFVYLGSSEKYDASIICDGMSRSCLVSFNGCKAYRVVYLGFIKRDVWLGLYQIPRRMISDRFPAIHKSIVDGVCNRQGGK